MQLRRFAYRATQGHALILAAGIDAGGDPWFATRSVLDYLGIGPRDVPGRAQIETRTADLPDGPAEFQATDRAGIMAILNSRDRRIASWVRADVFPALFDDAREAALASVLADAFEDDPAGSVLASDVMDRYTDRSVRQPVPRMTYVQLAKSLCKLGYERIRSNGTRYRGLRLKRNPASLLLVNGADSENGWSDIL